MGSLGVRTKEVMTEIHKDLDVIKIGEHKESWGNYTLMFFIVDLMVFWKVPGRNNKVIYNCHPLE